MKYSFKSQRLLQKWALWGTIYIHRKLPIRWQGNIHMLVDTYGGETRPDMLLSINIPQTNFGVKQPHWNCFSRQEGLHKRQTVTQWQLQFLWETHNFWFKNKVPHLKMITSLKKGYLWMFVIST